MKSRSKYITPVLLNWKRLSMRDAGKDGGKGVKDTAAQGATAAIRRDSHLMARMAPKREGWGVSCRALFFLIESAPSTQSRRQFLRASPAVT